MVPKRVCNGSEKHDETEICSENNESELSQEPSLNEVARRASQGHRRSPELLEDKASAGVQMPFLGQDDVDVNSLLERAIRLGKFELTKSLVSAGATCPSRTSLTRMC